MRDIFTDEMMGSLKESLLEDLLRACFSQQQLNRARRRMGGELQLLRQGARVRTETEFFIPDAVRTLARPHGRDWNRRSRPAQKRHTLKPGVCPRCSNARHFGRCRIKPEAKS